jgi:hypothetical protein
VREPATVLGGPLGDLVQPSDLPWLGGDGEVPGAREAAVDAVPVHRLLDRVEVGPPQPLQRGNLAGEPGGAVVQTVGQAGRAEAAVAAGGGRSGGMRLQQHDVAVGVAPLGQQRGPQAGEAAADDGEVGRAAGAQWLGGCRCVGLVEPVRARGGVGQRSADRAVVHGGAIGGRAAGR